MESPTTPAEWQRRRRITECLDVLARGGIPCEGPFDDLSGLRCLRAGRSFLDALREWRGAGGLDTAPFLAPELRRDMHRIFVEMLDDVRRDVEANNWGLACLRLAYGAVAYLGSFDWARASGDDQTRLTFIALVMECASGAEHYWCELWEPEDHPLMKLPWVRRLWEPSCRALPTEQELRRLATQSLQAKQAHLISMPYGRLRVGRSSDFAAEVRALREAIFHTLNVFEVGALAVAAWSLELVGREGFAGGAVGRGGENSGEVGQRPAIAGAERSKS